MFNRAYYYNALYSVDAAILPKDSDILSVPSPLDTETNDTLFPQDPTTGQLADLLSQILQTDNPLLRDSLMSKLETLPSTSSALHGVDDDVKIQLLKPRSAQSLSEMADYAEYVSKAIDQLNVPITPEHDSEPASEPESETVETVES